MLWRTLLFIKSLDMSYYKFLEEFFLDAIRLPYFIKTYVRDTLHGKGV